LARSPDHPQAFTRARKLPLPTLLGALLSFRGASVQSELDAFFASLRPDGAAVLVSDRALAKARAKLHVPALWALNERLICGAESQGALHLFKGRRLVCADGTLLAPAQRGIDFVIRCDSTQGWGAARNFLRSGQSECWSWLSPSDAQQASTWELDGSACMRARLVRHVSTSGRTRVLATSLPEDVASAAELADLYHGRWCIEQAFKRLKHRLGLESVSGLSQHALLVDVATKVLADNLAALLNRAVPMAVGESEGVRRQVNRAAASKLFSRSIGSMLLIVGGIAQGIHDWIVTLSRCWTRHIPGRSRPRNHALSKPHPSQSYKRAA
jgi:hypothetical protein